MYINSEAGMKTTSFAEDSGPSLQRNVRTSFGACYNLSIVNTYVDLPGDLPITQCMNSTTVQYLDISRHPGG